MQLFDFLKEVAWPAQSQQFWYAHQQQSANFQVLGLYIQYFSDEYSLILSESKGNKIWPELQSFSSLSSIGRIALLPDNLTKKRCTFDHESEVIFCLKAKLEFSDKRRPQFSKHKSLIFHDCFPLAIQDELLIDQFQRIVLTIPVVPS